MAEEVHPIQAFVCHLLIAAMGRSGDPVLIREVKEDTGLSSFVVELESHCLLRVSVEMLRPPGDEGEKPHVAAVKEMIREDFGEQAAEQIERELKGPS